MLEDGKRISSSPALGRLAVGGASLDSAQAPVLNIQSSYEIPKSVESSTGFEMNPEP